MRILIAGAGQIGIALAKYLRAENHEIILIDAQSKSLSDLSEQLDIQTVVGSAASPVDLERSGASGADILLAVTGDDQTNIVSCSLAKELFHISKRIARVSSNDYLQPKYADFLKALSIDVVVSPELETAHQIITCLPINGLTDMTILGGGRVRFLGLRCRGDISLIGKNIDQINKLIKDVSISVVSVVRHRKFIPLNEVELQANDEIYLFADTSHIPYLLDIFGCEETPLKNILLFGGGGIGSQTAKLLEIESDDPEITLVEQDKKRSIFLAEHLKKTLVINGDGFDDALLDEINLKNNQISIATTHSDENNVLLSLVAKRAGVRRTCALIRNDLYKQYLRGLGVDFLINPNAVMVSAILQHLRKGRLANDYFLQSGMGEVLEMDVLKTSKITSSALGRVKIPRGVQIGGVLRDGIFIRPRKDLHIKEGDKVFVFVERGYVAAAEKLFTVRLSFFS